MHKSVNAENFLWVESEVQQNEQSKRFKAREGLTCHVERTRRNMAASGSRDQPARKRDLSPETARN